MKNFIILLSCLLLSNNLAYAMQGKQTPEGLLNVLDSATQPTAPDNAFKKIYPHIIIDGKQEHILADATIIKQLNDKERDALRTHYIKLYCHLQCMPREKAKTHPLRKYKKAIFAASQILFASEKARCEWLKVAHHHNTEEKELDSFNPESTVRTRYVYELGKRSVAQQLTQSSEIIELTKAKANLLDKKTSQEAQKALLLAQINVLVAQSKQTEKELQRIGTEIEITQAGFIATAQVYNKSLEMLETQLKDLTTLLKTLTGQELIEAKKLQAALQRDIDLLTSSYTLDKKIKWCLGFEYPVDNHELTPGAPTILEPSNPN